MCTPLPDLPFGKPARVDSFAPGAESTLSLMELGFVPGAEVEVIRQAPLGDPLEIEVLGARLAIRREVAESILVEPVEPQVDAA